MNISFINLLFLKTQRKLRRVVGQPSVDYFIVLAQNFDTTIITASVLIFITPNNYKKYKPLTQYNKGYLQIKILTPRKLVLNTMYKTRFSSNTISDPL